MWRLKFALFTILLFLVSFFIYSCATSSGPATVKERQTGVSVGKGKNKMVEVLKCKRNTNIRVAIGDVKCKAAACKSTNAGRSSGLFALLRLAGVPNFEGIGNGLQDMFTTALQQTGCFRIINKEALKNMEEYGIKIKAKKPDYIVIASVTSINFTRRSGSFGGGLIPIIGAISSTKEKASMTMDFQLVDTKTGEIVFSKTYTAESGKTSYGIGGVGYYSGIGFGGAVSGLSGTAMEEVARDIIVRASYDVVKYIAPPDLIEIKYEPINK